MRAFQSYGAVAESSSNKWPCFRKEDRKGRSKHAAEWAGLPPNLAAVALRLQGVVIESTDATTLMRHIDGPDVLHYVDPPYVLAARKARQRKVYRREMTDADHRALARVLHDLKGMVVLSGYYSPLYDRLYKGWEVQTQATYGEKATKRLEVLWLNPAAARRQPTLQLGLVAA